MIRSDFRPSQAEPDPWKGTERYEVVGNLGAGGMGVVYEVFDRDLGRRVALKTWLDFDPAALYRFKQEFRTLADIRHRNLVHLYELAVDDGGRVFFTMELVRGVDFARYVQHAEASDALHVRSRMITVRPPSTGRQTAPPAEDAASAVPIARQAMHSDESRLRGALRQLVQGIHAVHGSGKLHRDIKPSNVLVTAEGRVVVLDFGVAGEIDSRGRLHEDSGEIVGTARYMAPEQAASEPTTPASDWYSVGVMLHEALVGQPPFTGSPTDVMAMKTMLDPAAPAERVRGVPADLEALCMDMLRREASTRPSGAEILRRLGVRQSSAPPPSRLSTSADRTTAVIGRDDQMAALRDAFAAVRPGRAVALKIGGASGMGKSTVVRRFIDQLEETGQATVLRGRAYEREAIPFKAVDGVIDALSNHLVLRIEEGDRLALPADITTLARVFPVFGRVLSDASPREDALDPVQVRTRAFASLRATLRSLGEQRPVVVFVDDVQWGDVDSAGLLVDLVRPPDAPPLLLVMTYRDDMADTSPFLVDLRSRWPEGAEMRDVSVGPLAAEDAYQLALALLGSSGAQASRTARVVARESGGSPFLVEELVRSNLGVAATEGATLAVLTLDQMVCERLERLPEAARRLMEIVAVGGRPLPVPVAADAAGSIETADELVALLDGRRFARTSLRQGLDVVEPSHDRIREIIVAQLLPATLRGHHERLAEAIERAGGAEAEALSEHWFGAGNVERGTRFAEAAAEQAADKLAFDHAARLFRLTLDSAPSDFSGRRRVRKRLAEALRFAGRAQESAREYLAAAEGAPTDERVEFQRAAAEQLLSAGQIDEGKEMLHRVLAAVGIHAPRSSAWAVFWLLVYRTWLALRGLQFRERMPAEVSPQNRLRVEALFTAAMQFSMVDVIVGACMQARHLIEALRVGDRFQVLRATSLEAGHMAAQGKRPTRREVGLVETSRALATREGTNVANVYFAGAWGIGLWTRGRWREAATMLDSAERDIRHGHGGFANASLFAVYARQFLGDFRGAAERLVRGCAQAADRGDLYTLVNLRTSVGIQRWLMLDDPGRARKDLDESLAKWSQASFNVQRWQGMVYGADIDLYSDHGARAYEPFVRQLPALRRSFLLHVGYIRVMTAFTHARVAVGSIEPDSSPERRRERIAEARRLARRIEHEIPPWAAAVASLVRAIAENAEGDRPRAIAELREGVARLEATETLVLLDLARYRLGQLVGGDEGRTLMDAAVDALRSHGMVRPERYAAIYLPGDFDSTQP